MKTTFDKWSLLTGTFSLFVFFLPAIRAANEKVCGKWRGEFYFLIEDDSSPFIRRETLSFLQKWFIPRIEESIPESSVSVGEVRKTCRGELPELHSMCQVGKQKSGGISVGDEQQSPRQQPLSTDSLPDSLTSAKRSDRIKPSAVPNDATSDVSSPPHINVLKSVIMLNLNPNTAAAPQQQPPPSTSDKGTFDCTPQSSDMVISTMMAENVFPLLIDSTTCERKEPFLPWQSWMSSIANHNFGVDGVVLKLCKDETSEEIVSMIMQKLEEKTCGRLTAQLDDGHYDHQPMQHDSASTLEENSGFFASLGDSSSSAHSRSSSSDIPSQHPLPTHPPQVEQALNEEGPNLETIFGATAAASFGFGVLVVGVLACFTMSRDKEGEEFFDENIVAASSSPDYPPPDFTLEERQEQEQAKLPSRNHGFDSQSHIDFKRDFASHCYAVSLSGTSDALETYEEPSLDV